jgi:hypothetical protein
LGDITAALGNCWVQASTTKGLLIKAKNGKILEFHKGNGISTNSEEINEQ